MASTSSPAGSYRPLFILGVIVLVKASLYLTVLSVALVLAKRDRERARRCRACAS